MLTTLDVDDAVFTAAEALAKKEGRPVGQLLSELVREALEVRTNQAPSGTPRGRYGFHPLPARGVVVTNELVNDLRDELGV